jgi:VCBS repeat protein
MMKRPSAIVALAALIFIGAAFFLGCNSSTSTSNSPPAPTAGIPEPGSTERIAEADPAEVKRFCGYCHAFPPPDSFPRRLWREEVQRGFKFAAGESLKPPIPPPPFEPVVRYYENLAPTELPVLPKTPPSKLPVKLEKHGYRDPARPDRFAIANVCLGHLTDPKKLDIILCDMMHGQVWLLRPDAPEPKFRLLCGTIPHPGHAEVVDLDGDGIKDLLIANLGTVKTSNEKLGSVVWLRGMADGMYKPVTLLEGVGRVADVQAADFRGVGKLDLVVASFGHVTAGGIYYLENQTTDYEQPKFVPRLLDQRNGAIHVPVGDINGDGKPDFCAVISQEHETVVAFLNDGKGQFTPKTLYTAPHPAWGSTGIQLVDLDGDGKLDVLYTNGDSMEKQYLQHFHGIHWLRNEGTYPFTDHLLTNMYGVHRAVAADLRGSGKLDIVAVTYLPDPSYRPHRPGLDAIAILEQTSPGVFVRHTLEANDCDHPTCAVGDLDGDGRQHIVVGNIHLPGSKPTNDDWVAIWRNLGPSRNAKSSEK